jgi:tellurite resistance protein TerC
MEKPLWMWGMFFAIIATLWVLDQGVLHKKNKVVSFKESIFLTILYMVIALGYGGWIWYELGATSGKQYITGYLVEFTLAMDNIFAISLIMTYFAIPRIYQHRLLFWGIMGAIVFRGIMIAAGAAIIDEFHWVLYIFASFLIFTGIKMLIVSNDEEQKVEDNKFLMFIKSKLRVTEEHHGQNFIVKKPSPINGKLVWFFTPAGIALILIEFADVIFAVDSVPAIFAITKDPFIVYTSNIFAILGLRNLYFALDAMIHRFKYLKYSLSLVLIFIGGKMFIPLFTDFKHIPEWISLTVTLVLLIGGVIFSMYKTREKRA